MNDGAKPDIEPPSPKDRVRRYSDIGWIEIPQCSGPERRGVLSFGPPERV